MAKLVKQYFTANGTWTAPAGVTEVLLIGAGGGGGGSSSGGAGDGGSGGGGSIQVSGYVAVTPNTGYTVTIGAGGAGGLSTGAGNGSDGGTTSFGTLFYAKGGGGASWYFGSGNIAWNGGTNFPGLTLPTGNFMQQQESAYGGNGGGQNITGTGAPMAGASNWSGNGSYSGGAIGTDYPGNGSRGGSGGGAGPQGNGAAGGAGRPSGTGPATDGSSAAANTGSGGGGGGGRNDATVHQAGGSGGSGYLYVIWVD